MKDIVNEIADLYYEAKKKLGCFEDTFDEHDYYRYITGAPDLTERYKKFHTEYFDYESLLKEISTYEKTWVKKVRGLLTKTGKHRFLLEFDDPSGGGNTTGMLVDRPNKRVEAVHDALSSLSENIEALRAVLPELERTIEKPLKLSGDIEPPSYDHSKKTLFFADEAFRFTKSAEYMPAICELLINTKPEQRTWTLSELVKIWEPQVDFLGEAPSDWKRVHNAVKRINNRIVNKVGINDLFILDTKTVSINRKYLPQK